MVGKHVVWREVIGREPGIQGDSRERMGERVETKVERGGGERYEVRKGGRDGLGELGRYMEG